MIYPPPRTPGRLPTAEEIAVFDWQAVLWLTQEDDFDFTEGGAKPPRSSQLCWEADFNNLDDIIIAVASKNKFKSLTQLIPKHFNELGLMKAYSKKIFDHKLQNMFTAVMKNTRNLDVELDKKIIRTKSKKEKEKELKEIFKDVPVLEPPEEWVQKREKYEELKEMIPTIIENLKENPLAAKIELTTGCGVYLGVELKNHTIIIDYVGSSNEYHKRELVHILSSSPNEVKDDNDVLELGNVISECSSNDKFKKYSSDFHKHIIGNDLKWGEDIFLIPIIECPVGFETLLEADVYDYLSSPINCTLNVELKNTYRPLTDGVDVNSLAAIYEISTFNALDPNRYGGSVSFHRYCDRRDDHFRIGFGEKESTKKIYKWIFGAKPLKRARALQQMKADNLHQNIQMKPVLVVPIYMRFDQEKKFIKDNNLVENGLNMANVNVTKEEHKERMRLWRIKNAEAITKSRKIYEEKNKEIIKTKRKENYDKNPEFFREKSKNWSKNNPEKVQMNNKKQYEKNKEKNQEYQRERRKNLSREKKDQYNEARRMARAEKKAKSAAAKASTSTDNN